MTAVFYLHRINVPIESSSLVILENGGEMKRGRKQRVYGTIDRRGTLRTLRQSELRFAWTVVAKKRRKVLVHIRTGTYWQPKRKKDIISGWGDWWSWIFFN